MSGRKQRGHLTQKSQTSRKKGPSPAHKNKTQENLHTSKPEVPVSNKLKVNNYEPTNEQDKKPSGVEEDKQNELIKDPLVNKGSDVATTAEEAIKETDQTLSNSEDKFQNTDEEMPDKEKPADSNEKDDAAAELVNKPEQILSSNEASSVTDDAAKETPNTDTELANHAAIETPNTDTEPLESMDKMNVSTTEKEHSDDRTAESRKVEDKTSTPEDTKPESAHDSNVDEGTRTETEQSGDGNVELVNTVLEDIETTDETNAVSEREIENSEAANKNGQQEQEDISSPVQNNEEHKKKNNGEDNEDSELIKTILKEAPEISSFTETLDEKKRGSLLQNVKVSDLEIVIKDGAVHITLVQNKNRDSNQKYTLNVKRISDEDGFNPQNVLSRSTDDKDREEKKTCEKSELVNKQSIEMVEEKDDDKIDLKKKANEEDSEIKQEEHSLPKNKFPEVLNGEEKIDNPEIELENQSSKESINAVGEEEGNKVTNEISIIEDPEREQEELSSPETQPVLDNYIESEQVNELNKETNGAVGKEASANKTNVSLEKEDLEKEEVPSSPEKKQSGVLDGETNDNVSDPVNQPNKDSNNIVGEEETYRKINETLNTEDSNMKQENNLEPVKRQPGFQNGGEIVNKASELSIIKTEMEKENALNYEVMDEEGSICSNVSWNEIDPLRFHYVHGANVRLSTDGSLAQRHKFSSFFGKGIVFSSRPVGIGEKICIRFEEVSNYWLGFMTFGFTNHDPETLACDLPGIAVTDLDNKPGFWAGHLAKTFCNKGNIFHYFVNSSGNVNFGINGVDKGTMFWNVDITKPIWALSDLFGYFTAISLVDPRIPIETKSFTPFKGNQHFGITPWITTSLYPSLKYQKGFKLVPMNLHPTKGLNVQMLNFKGIVARSNDTTQGYVFTERPMYLGQTIVIQVLTTGPGYEYLPIGLTCHDPATVNPRELPDNAEGLSEWGQNWVLFKNIANFVQYEDEIAVTRTVDGDIRLRKNDGESITVARFGREQKFWAFVDMYGATQMLRVWTTKRLCPCTRQTSRSSLI